MIAHWDEVESHRREKGPMAASWQWLGDAAGTKGIGVNRIRIDPGRLSTPPHSHGVAEETYFVLHGSGLLWQDGEVYEVGRGDTIVQVADREEHTLRAGSDGLDVLAFGNRAGVEFAWLPRSHALRFGAFWAEGRDDDPWDVEATAGELEFAAPGDRPPNIAGFDDLPFDEDGDKLLARAAGAQQTGLNWIRRDPGRRGAVPHCHSLESEAFVVLEGGGTLELWPTPTAVAYGATRESHELRAGHVVSRPGGSRIAHSIVAGPDGITYLAYGTREPGDVCYYPRSNKIAFRGVGLIARVEPLDYWDGETLDE